MRPHAGTLSRASHHFRTTPLHRFTPTVISVRSYAPPTRKLPLTDPKVYPPKYHVKGVPVGEKTMHPEAYLEIARNWPHDPYHPEQYFTGPVRPPNIHGPLPDGTRLGHGPGVTTGEESKEWKESYFTPFWTKLIASVIGGLALIRLSDYYTADEPANPVSKWWHETVASLNPKGDSLEKLAIINRTRQREADDRFVFSSRGVDYYHYLETPHALTRASEILISPGTEVDMTDAIKNFRYSWAKDDDLFGPPYPKNKKKEE
ncbi:hypothetical protein HK104_004079 [Borealophlyctis nickersoniae]|nr:hypothetical protein HK104_004079 [Borealophlyctis nickersoniae]